MDRVKFVLLVLVVLLMVACGGGPVPDDCGAVPNASEASCKQL